MDFTSFSVKLVELLEKIEQCDSLKIPPDLSVVVATCFLETGIATFDLESNGYFNKCDANPKAMKPRVIIQKLKAKYVSLEGRSQWPHKNQKQKQDDLSAMHGKLNALQQKIDTLKSNNNKPSTTPSSTRDLTNVTCFECKKKGYTYLQTFLTKQPKAMINHSKVQNHGCSNHLVMESQKSRQWMERSTSGVQSAS